MVDKNNEYLTHKEALTLRDLGYTGLCTAYYFKTTVTEKNEEVYSLIEGKRHDVESAVNGFKDAICKAPTYHQAFKWFREEYGIAGLIEIGNQEFSYMVYNMRTDKGVCSAINYNGTYEEAESKCLEKLIEAARELDKLSVLNMEKIPCTPNKPTEVYSDHFSIKGQFIIDSIDLRENNPTSDKKLVAVVKAHHKDDPKFKVEATSDKFLFNS